MAAAGDLKTFARQELLARVGAAEQSIWLASPFLTRAIAEEIVDALPTNAAADRRLLTALVTGSVQVGALDPAALAVLSDGGFELRSIRNLHAKVSLIDDSWGLVGSGNLTNAGLGSTAAGNVELGVVLNAKQIDAAAAIYEGWWSEAAAISQAELEKFLDIPRQHKSGSRDEDGVGPALELADPKPLEEILGDEDSAFSRGYWIKANYHRRTEEGRGWWHRNWISDAKQASYAVDDLILFYLGAKYDGPRRAPATVRVKSASRFDPDFVEQHGDLEARDRWPYVTEIECVYEVPVTDGVPLEAINVSPSGLQGGRKRLSRQQFELAASYLLETGTPA